MKVNFNTFNFISSVKTFKRQNTNVPTFRSQPTTDVFIKTTLFRIRRVRYELDLVILRRFFDFDKNSAIRLAGGKVFSSNLPSLLFSKRK